MGEANGPISRPRIVVTSMSISSGRMSRSSSVVQALQRPTKPRPRLAGDETQPALIEMPAQDFHVSGQAYPGRGGAPLPAQLASNLSVEAVGGKPGILAELPQRGQDGGPGEARREVLEGSAGAL